jgi:dCTP diphosphatase
MNIPDLKITLRAFAEERDWEQFHSPKNLSMALAGEAGELLEHFQWLTEDESRSLVNDTARLAKVSEEVADIMIYVVRICDKLNINLESAVEAKIRANASKYPVSLSKGNATKYTEFDKK